VNRVRFIGLVIALLASAAPGFAVHLVRNGKPVAVVVAQKPEGRRPRGFPGDDRTAADVLVDWVQKITDAELSIAEAAPEGAPAILIGRAAEEAGLDLDDIESPTREGLRIRAGDRRVLIAGQCPRATLKAVCRFLEELGCRYFMDHPLGEVYPRTKTLRVGRLDITDEPGFRYRRIWGSTWTRDSLWKIWNGHGGVPMGMRHAWGGLFEKELFDEHPEYFRMNADGERQQSSWLCTSNPEVRRRFAQNVIQAIEKGARNPSISPPDGRGYCQCPACKAQDDPKSVEPSSGTVSKTNRYVDFFDAVGRWVAQARREAILGFYCYADYTQPPTVERKLSPNLCAWVAPIRYCRYHAIGSKVCPSRSQLAELIDGWAACVAKMGYRTYNYNLAECTVPFSKLAIWAHDIPYLESKGCIGINLETLHSWHIYGPHIYQSIRLAYSPDADSDALMDDYFRRFYGPDAGPPMQAYWSAIDDAFAKMKCHSGSFFALHHVYTPLFLDRCRKLLSQAAEAAKEHERRAQRVELARDGLRNAEDYMAVRAAMNRGDFALAKRLCDAMLERNEALVKQKLSNHYTPRYIRRFLGKIVDAGAEAVAAPNKLLAVLPDRWRLAYDEEDRGVAQGFHKPDFDDSDWLDVATYSAPLDAQGIDDRQTIQWYRTTFDFKEKPKGKQLKLFFTEVDGDATVFLNGGELGASEKKRIPFSVDATAAAREGENVVAVRVDHSSITELFLGGILRPVVVEE
jgi:hypothetical protein